MDGWNTTFLLGRPIFRGYVSFREGNLLYVDTSSHNPPENLRDYTPKTLTQKKHVSIRNIFDIKDQMSYVLRCCCLRSKMTQP